ncbi:MAG: HAD family hydrolase [Sulfurimonas sp.]|uniref:HAD family hydrolase n=1 Tax=Sulfurimonas sp. TaxID=2022749 RepID=UPI0025CF62AA|nr:HAD family hydrolase [Sulfurimonas sp.]MCK9492224.1 HAD family hydrolase [Sulfurimonas sp.]
MKVVIFDMDGTLIDSKKDITISVNYIREMHYGLEPLSEEYIVEVINMEVRNLPKLFYGTEHYEDRDRELFEVHYANQCVQNPYLYDGIKETLEDLVDSNVKISVATNAPTPFAKRMLKHLGVDEMFDIIIGADNVKNSKPDPQMLHHILNHYKYDEKKDIAWMVGDNSKDMLSAKAAGIESMFATWGFTPKSEHEIVVYEPKEILGIVL